MRAWINYFSDTGFYLFFFFLLFCKAYGIGLVSLLLPSAVTLIGTEKDRQCSPKEYGNNSGIYPLQQSLSSLYENCQGDSEVVTPLRLPALVWANSSTPCDARLHFQSLMFK